MILMITEINETDKPERYFALLDVDEDEFGV